MPGCLVAAVRRRYDTRDSRGTYPSSPRACESHSSSAAGAVGACISDHVCVMRPARDLLQHAAGPSRQLCTGHRGSMHVDFHRSHDRRPCCRPSSTHTEHRSTLLARTSPHDQRSTRSVPCNRPVTSPQWYSSRALTWQVAAQQQISRCFPPMSGRLAAAVATMFMFSHVYRPLVGSYRARGCML